MAENLVDSAELEHRYAAPMWKLKNHQTKGIVNNIETKVRQLSEDANAINAGRRDHHLATFKILVEKQRELRRLQGSIGPLRKAVAEAEAR